MPVDIPAMYCLNHSFTSPASPKSSPAPGLTVWALPFFRLTGAGLTTCAGPRLSGLSFLPAHGHRNQRLRRVITLVLSFRAASHQHKNQHPHRC